MGQANRLRLHKIVEEVKQGNCGFRRYLERQRIERLRGEDVVVFEGRMEEGLQGEKRMMASSGAMDRWLDM